MRQVSPTFRSAMAASATDEVFLVLITLNHPSWVAPARFSSDRVNTVSNGETFIAYPFEITLPGDEAAAIGRFRVRIDNVDRQIMQQVRDIVDEPIDITVDMVLASDPDTLEISITGFQLRGVTYDAYQIEGDAVFQDIRNEPVLWLTYNPIDMPGVFPN